MAKEGSLKLHKITIGTLKVIPMLLAFTTLINQIFSFFGIDLEVLGYIGGVSLLPMIFLYLASYCFKFCNYHRMFLHYVVVCDVVAIIDYYIGIPVSSITLFLYILIFTGIMLFIILYMYGNRNRCNKKSIAKNNQ